MSRPRNIIYLNTHDTGRYISPYGYGVPTPNLQTLAHQGTLFRRSFTVNPTCSPSRAALTTGQYAHSCGMLGLAHRGFALRDHTEHIAHHLHAQGYLTALAGFQHEAALKDKDGSEGFGKREVNAQALGYERLLSSEPRTYMSGSDNDIGNAMALADFLLEPATGCERPFFAALGLSNTHQPFPQRGSVNPNWVMPPAILPDTPEARQNWAWYCESAKVVDDCVGIVMHALRESGLDRDTMLVFTTDHGVPFPGMKCNLTDHGIGVALIIRQPGSPLVGSAIDALVSNVDLFPTWCDWAGIPTPERVQGRSLAPLLAGETDAHRERVFAEVNYHAAYEPQRCVRTDRYKLIRFFDEGHHARVPANIDDCLIKRQVRSAGFLDQQRADVQLYDCLLDPMERVNVAEDPALAGIRAELETALRDWMQTTGDPLLQAEAGRVPAPAGAVVNTRTTPEPTDKTFEEW